MPMKKFIIFTMSMLCYVATMAQEGYESLLSESKVWTMMQKPSVNPEVYGDLCYIIETKLVGDTIINGIHFMQKYERKCKQGDEMPATWTATHEYLGQDGGKIFLYSRKTEIMILDMDFSLEVGDKIGSYDLSICSDLNFSFEVTDVSDIVLANSTDQVSRSCVYVQVEENPSTTDIWIEGIGSMQYGISGVWQTLASGSFDQLIKCTDGDTILYLSDTSKEENPSGVKSPYILKEQPQTVYDLQGHRLSKLPQKGIYIHNGKKRQAR